MRRTALLLSLLIPLCLDAQSSTTAVLEGDVVSAATNAPLANARVRLQRLEPIYAKAGSKGHFVFAGLTPGRYRLSVESPGFMQSSNVQVDLTSPAARDSLIKGVPRGNLGSVKFSKQIADDGTIHGAVTVPLAGQAVITGKVTDPYGLPVIACNIEVLAKPTPRPGAPATAIASRPVFRASARTDDLGQYRVFGLQPETYWVVANLANYGGALTSESSQRATYYPAAIGIDAAKPIALASGQTMQADIQIVRAAGVRVSGKIIRPPSVPDSVVDVPGVGPRSTLIMQVVLVPGGGPPASNNVLTVAGKDDFEVKDVLPGKYTLMAAMRTWSPDGMGPDQKVVAGLVREVEIGQQDMAGLDLARTGARFAGRSDVWRGMPAGSFVHSHRRVQSGLFQSG